MAVASKDKLEIRGIGEVLIDTSIGLKKVKVELKRTLYVPNIESNLVSVAKITKNQNLEASSYNKAV